MAEILAKLRTPSIQERVAEVSVERLTNWAQAMAAGGYRHSEATLEALRLYLAGYGLFVKGGVGTGKTMFFRSVGEVVRQCGGRRPVVYPMMDTVGRKVDEVREFFADNAGSEMILDDLGAEPTFNEYGNRWEILPWLVEMRLAAPGRTHFTTNLAPKDLERRYGARTVDRIHEMAASVAFAGGSNRHTKVNAGVVDAFDRVQKTAQTQTAQAAEI